VSERTCVRADEIGWNVEDAPVRARLPSHRRKELEMTSADRIPDGRAWKPWDYRSEWTTAHGPLPKPCVFCGDMVERWGYGEGGCVHHVDENHGNNDPANLAIAHHACHCRHHLAIRREDPTWAARLSAGQRRRFSEGRVFSAIHRARLSDSNRRQQTCTECGREVNRHWMRRHQASGCVKYLPRKTD